MCLQLSVPARWRPSAGRDPLRRPPGRRGPGARVGLGRAWACGGKGLVLVTLATERTWLSSYGGEVEVRRRGRRRPRGEVRGSDKKGFSGSSSGALGVCPSLGLIASESVRNGKKALGRRGDLEGPAFP